MLMGLPSFCIIASCVGVYSAPSVPALEQIGTNWNNHGVAMEYNHVIIVPSYFMEIDNVYMHFSRAGSKPAFSFSIPISASLTRA